MKLAYLITAENDIDSQRDFWAERFTDWLTYRIKHVDHTIRFSIMSLEPKENKRFFVLYVEKDRAVDRGYWMLIFGEWLDRIISMAHQDTQTAVYNMADLERAITTLISMRNHPSAAEV